MLCADPQVLPFCLDIANCRLEDELVEFSAFSFDDQRFPQISSSAGTSAKESLIETTIKFRVD